MNLASAFIDIQAAEAKEKEVNWVITKRFDLVFLDAFSHLYERACPSVRQSVHPLVRQSVRRSHTS